MNRDDGPIGTEAQALLLRVLTPWNVEADAELARLQAEHADLTARVAALPPPVTAPRWRPPPAGCPKCVEQAREYRHVKAALIRDRALALKTAQREQKKRLALRVRYEAAIRHLAESRVTIDALRHGKILGATIAAPRTGSNPRRYGSD